MSDCLAGLLAEKAQLSEVKEEVNRPIQINRIVQQASKQTRVGFHVLALSWTDLHGSGNNMILVYFHKKRNRRFPNYLLNKGHQVILLIAFPFYEGTIGDSCFVLFYWFPSSLFAHKIGSGNHKAVKSCLITTRQYPKEKKTIRIVGRGRRRKDGGKCSFLTSCELEGFLALLEILPAPQKSNLIGVDGQSRRKFAFCDWNRWDVSKQDYFKMYRDWGGGIMSVSPPGVFTHYITSGI